MSYHAANILQGYIYRSGKSIKCRHHISERALSENIGTSAGLDDLAAPINVDLCINWLTRRGRNGSRVCLWVRCAAWEECWSFGACVRPNERQIVGPIDPRCENSNGRRVISRTAILAVKKYRFTSECCINRKFDAFAHGETIHGHFHHRLLDTVIAFIRRRAGQPAISDSSLFPGVEFIALTKSRSKPAVRIHRSPPFHCPFNAARDLWIMDIVNRPISSFCSSPLVSSSLFSLLRFAVSTDNTKRQTYIVPFKT